MRSLKEFDPNKTTTFHKVFNGRKISWIAAVGAIGSIGAMFVAITTITGVNLRPAWAYEVEKLASNDKVIESKINKVLEIQGKTTAAITNLQRDQLEIRVHQIDQQKRELRRELAEYRNREQQFRDNGDIVPQWLVRQIADTEARTEELNRERSAIETRLLHLEN